MSSGDDYCDILQYNRPYLHENSFMSKTVFSTMPFHSFNSEVLAFALTVTAPLVQCRVIEPNGVALSLTQHDVLWCSAFQVPVNSTTVVADVQHLMS